MSSIGRLAKTFRRTALQAIPTVIGIVVINFILLQLAGDPLSMVGRPLLWPGQNRAFPLGTASLGRDLAAGLFHGARISLLVGVAATLIGLTLGILLGSVAGYHGGWVDDVLVRLIELFQTISALAWKRSARLWLARLIRPIREHPGQFDGQTETPLGHRQKHHAPVRARMFAICCGYEESTGRQAVKSRTQSCAPRQRRCAAASIGPKNPTLTNRTG